jgi:uncharacterized integral membrane protein (TIGR00698 family)
MPGKILIPVGVLLCLAPFMSSGLALLLGVLIAVAFGNPYLTRTRQLTHRLLAYSVMGLGAGMDLAVVGKVGLQGIGYTVIGISTALLLGMSFGKLFKTEKDTSVLISVGTAICGGSAIAAVAPVIRAKHHEVSVALGIVFLLNAAALFIFPFIGHSLNLTQTQFGLWCALAIHDTSSVVGAALQYGSDALQIATTVKLARALWIIPVAFLMGLLYSRGAKTEPQQKTKKPWFILGFIIAAALVTAFPTLRAPGHTIDAIAKRTLVATLFLIGASLTRETVKNVGIKPFLHGFCLWLTVGSATLGAILVGWIH